MRSHSFSSVSSVSSTDAEPTVQLFIKDVAGNTFPLTVPANTTVATLLELISLRNHQPASSLRLVYAGKHLSSLSSPLVSYPGTSITSESTLHLALPLRGGAPKKLRCNFKECKDAAQRIVGDCGFCQGHFCGRHRMLESHSCPGLENCKQQEKERNREKLESERTVAIRGI